MDAPKFLIKWHGETYGPYERNSILEYLKEGRINGSALVRGVNETEWQTVEAFVAQRTVIPPALPAVIPAQLPDTHLAEPSSQVTPFTHPETLDLQVIDIPQAIVRKSNWWAAISKLPWPIRFIIIAALLITISPIATMGAGLVIFGLGFGIPIIGIAAVWALSIIGLITVVKTMRQNPSSSAYLKVVLELIAHDAAILKAKRDLRKAMAEETVAPAMSEVPSEEAALRQSLLSMDAFDFERHVMAFFQAKGIIAWATKKTNDAGVDGFARHPSGLIVVQCKRNSPENCVGRPVVQQFKGVVEENQAWRGYIVTTSSFTQQAIDSADLNSRLALIDMDALVAWHKEGLKF